MSGRIGLQCPGAFEGGPGVLSEIDRALAMLGATHWTQRSEPAARWVRPKRDKFTLLFDAATVRMALDKV
jgi:hypothetical protein